jgi:hypothetical protein
VQYLPKPFQRKGGKEGEEHDRKNLKQAGSSANPSDMYSRENTFEPRPEY